MKRLGKVLHVSSTGNIVLRAVRVPEIGTKVVDERMKEIGAVYDIIGPVGSPYVLVKPGKDINPELLHGKPLYVLKLDERKRTRRRKKAKKQSKT